MPRHRTISFHGFTMDNRIMDAETVWKVIVKSLISNSENFSTLFNYDFDVSVYGVIKERKANEDEMKRSFSPILLLFCTFVFMASLETEERKVYYKKTCCKFNQKKCNVDRISNFFPLKSSSEHLENFHLLECIKHKYAIFLQTLKNWKLSERNNLFLF